MMMMTMKKKKNCFTYLLHGGNTVDEFSHHFWTLNS